MIGSTGKTVRQTPCLILSNFNPLGIQPQSYLRTAILSTTNSFFFGVSNLMQKFILLRTGLQISLLLLLVATAAQAQKLVELRWLTGWWVSETSEELWSHPSGKTMFGYHRKVKDGETPFYEFLRLEQTDSEVIYWALPSGQSLTPFRLSESGPNWAVFSNPEHDFPKQIRYTRDDDKLTVEISDGGTKTSSWSFRLADFPP